MDNLQQNTEQKEIQYRTKMIQIIITLGQVIFAISYNDVFNNINKSQHVQIRNT